jgi:hypothetical protein
LPNPFAAVAPITGGPLNIKIYFPRAEQPSGQLLELALPRKATIEDAIALALWTYWERHWLPELNVSRPRDIDVTSWIMLVPGKDGVVNKRIAQSSCWFLSYKLPDSQYAGRQNGKFQFRQIRYCSFSSGPF